MRRVVALVVAAAARACAASAGDGVPVFPRAYSSHEVTVTKLGLSRENWKGSVHWDLDRNMTSYIIDCDGILCPGTPSAVYNYAPCTGGGLDPCMDSVGQKIYYITGAWGTKYARCDYYCDMQADLQCNLQDSLCPYDYNSAKLTGTVEQDGVLCDQLEWEEKLGPVSMNSLTLYARHGEAVPVRMLRSIHVPGFQKGQTDTNFTNFTAGPPPDAAFAVPGIDKCGRGEDGQCQNAAAALLRRGRRV